MRRTFYQSHQINNLNSKIWKSGEEEEEETPEFIDKHFVGVEGRRNKKKII